MTVAMTLSLTASVIDTVTVIDTDNIDNDNVNGLRISVSDSDSVIVIDSMRASDENLFGSQQISVHITSQLSPQRPAE